jgi:hypothetical protein
MPCRAVPCHAVPCHAVPCAVPDISLSQAIEKGDAESARIFAENAIRKKNEALSYVRCAALCLVVLLASISICASLSRVLSFADATDTHL